MNAKKARQFADYAASGKEFTYTPSKKRLSTYLILCGLLLLLAFLMSRTPGGVKTHPWLFLGVVVLLAVLLIKAVTASFKMAKVYRFTSDAVWIVSKSTDTEIPFEKIASALMPGWFTRLATGNLVSHLKVWTREGTGYRPHLLNDLPDARIVLRLILDKAAAIQGVRWAELVGNPYHLEYVREQKKKGKPPGRKE